WSSEVSAPFTSRWATSRRYWIWYGRTPSGTGREDQYPLYPRDQCVEWRRQPTTTTARSTNSSVTPQNYTAIDHIQVLCHTPPAQPPFVTTCCHGRQGRDSAQQSASGGDS